MIERVGLDQATAALEALSEARRSIMCATHARRRAGLPGADPVAGWLHVSKTDE